MRPTDQRVGWRSAAAGSHGDLTNGRDAKRGELPVFTGHDIIKGRDRQPLRGTHGHDLVTLGHIGHQHDRLGRLYSEEDVSAISIVPL